MPAKTNCRPSARQLPADWTNSRLWRWLSTAVSVILRSTLPVRASARKRSMENRSRFERNISFEPSGLTDGAML